MYVMSYADLEREILCQRAKCLPKWFHFRAKRRTLWILGPLFPQKISPAAWPIELQIYLFNLRPYLRVKYKCLWKGHILNIISHFYLCLNEFFSVWPCLVSCFIKDLKLITGRESSKCISEIGSDESLWGPGENMRRQVPPTRKVLCKL